MPTHHEVIAAQALVMANPERLRLLGLILADPRGESDARTLAEIDGPFPDLFTHLAAMTAAGILAEHDRHYRPTHDALARFGGLASGVPEQGRAPDAVDYDRVLGTISAELSVLHDGVLAPETVHEFVVESFDLLSSRATVQRFLPQLTARFAADRLEVMASLATRGSLGRDDVLFVCVRNAGRSQIAAALMRSMAGDAVRIRTAGSAPAARLDPAVQEELARLGVAQLTEFPRPLTHEVVRASGVVVTMGCGDACPLVPGRRYVDWPVDDPVGQPASEIRRIIADIGYRVEMLVKELGISPDPALIGLLGS